MNESDQVRHQMTHSFQTRTNQDEWTYLIHYQLIFLEMKSVKILGHMTHSGGSFGLKSVVHKGQNKLWNDS